MENDVWDAIWETYFYSENSSSILKIKTKLWRLKQSDREVTDYYMEMMALWKDLYSSTEEEWDYPGDCPRYQKIVSKMVYEFLAGPHCALDEGRILSRRLLPSTREVFA